MSAEGGRTGRIWLVAWLIAAGLLAGLAVFFSLARDGSDRRDPRPLGDVEDIAQLAQRDDVNVLFILIDTLRAHRLDSYGYARETSPTLSYLARTGVRFGNHLAQSSWTKASMASLWTGVNPVRTGVTRFAHALPDTAVLPAEILRDAGFRTAGIWRNGWVASNFGFDQGFETYHRPVGRPTPARVRRENPNITLEGSDEDAVGAAVEFLRIHAASRFFLYVHLMDVHQYLYDAESAVFGVTYSDLYDNSVLHQDGVVLQLISALAGVGVMDKTLVIVASDHGEAFGERGLQGHARHVYRESTEVPLFLGFPFRLAEGISIGTPTRNIDVWPTVLELLGLPPLPETDGRSLVPEILAAGRATPPPRPAELGIAHLDRSWGNMNERSKPAVAVWDGSFRFIHEQNPGGDREELFSLGRDRAEQRNVIEDEPKRAERMRAIAKGYLAQPPLWQGGAPIVEIDQMERNQLRALGYAVP